MKDSSKELNAFLYTLLEEAAGPLPAVTHRRMFGCDAVFAEGNIFGFIWVDGRIAVKLPDPAAYKALLAQAGTDPWRIHGKEKPMSHWLLVPETFHDEPARLAEWVVRAHAAAISRGPKPPKAPKAIKKAPAKG